MPPDSHDSSLQELPTELESVLPDVRLQLDPDPVEAMPALRRRLAALLLEGAQAHDFSRRLAFIEAGLRLTLRNRPDDSLLVLVQMLSDRQYGYCATHALLVASACLLVAPLVPIDEPQQSALLRAALTMNIALAELQDLLATQVQQTTEHQRDKIASHPSDSAALLRALGVTDPDWLRWVQDHHEAPDGSGYPSQKTELDLGQQLLHMSDLFVARISPRRTRRGLWPQVVVGNLYLQAQASASPLGGYFAKQLGMYPPGTLVRLKTDETALVVRRGAKINTPLTLAITGPDDMLLNSPVKRDTQVPLYAIKATVSAEDVRIRLDLGRLLKRV